MSKVVEVSAAVLLRQGGQQYLLAQRPEGKVYAGYWEFPGGKVEPGETHRHALDRELHEELGIHVTAATPWLSRRFVYPHASVRLKFFLVTAWDGEIAPIEHSGFAWVSLSAAPEVAPILPANDPILRALSLPERYAITNAADNGIAAELARLERGLQEGLKLLQIRDKTLPPEQRADFAHRAARLAQSHGARVLVNDDADLARAIGADGLHLSAGQLMAADQRPDFPWVAASCHDAQELARAAELGMDFVVLGPVAPTPTHPGQPGLGWEAFAQLVDDCPLPVYALGGMTADQLDRARASGAHGLALMRGW